MTEIRVPKLNNNDTQYVLVEWIAKDGAAVRRGDPLAVLETSKAAEEITAEDEGLLGHLLAEGADCEPGQLIARLLPEGVPPVTPAPAAEPAGPSAPEGGEPLRAPGGPVITSKARALMERHGIGEDAVRALGKKIVRESDIESLAAGSPGTPPDTAADGAPARPFTATDPPRT